jgi:hypothetical protein
MFFVKVMIFCVRKLLVVRRGLPSLVSEEQNDDDDAQISKIKSNQTSQTRTNRSPPGARPREREKDCDVTQADPSIHPSQILLLVSSTIGIALAKLLASYDVGSC